MNPDGSITMPSDILPSATGTPVGIVYDAHGSVTDALLGLGAGDPSQCFYNAALGGDDNLSTGANFLHALVVLNGNCAQTWLSFPTWSTGWCGCWGECWTRLVAGEH